MIALVIIVVIVAMVVTSASRYDNQGWMIVPVIDVVIAATIAVAACLKTQQQRHAHEQEHNAHNKTPCAQDTSYRDRKERRKLHQSVDFLVISWSASH
jgi:Na+/melibiose symporter-like transporter